MNVEKSPEKSVVLVGRQGLLAKTGRENKGRKIFRKEHIQASTIRSTAGTICGFPSAVIAGISPSLSDPPTRSR
jgi:hypothetical protein